MTRQYYRVSTLATSDESGKPLRWPWTAVELPGRRPIRSCSSSAVGAPPLSARSADLRRRLQASGDRETEVARGLIEFADLIEEAQHAPAGGHEQLPLR